jgi:hypothetical protein
MPKMTTDISGRNALSICGHRGRTEALCAFLAGERAFPLRRDLWARLFPWRTVCASSHWEYRQNIVTGEQVAVRRDAAGHMPAVPGWAPRI